MAEALNVEARESHGKREVAPPAPRRAAFRPCCTVTARQTLSLAVPADQMAAVVRHGSRVVELEGAVKEKAFIRDLQWDTLRHRSAARRFCPRLGSTSGSQSKSPSMLRGQAPGVKDGGVVEHLHPRRRNRVRGARDSRKAGTAASTT